MRSSRRAAALAVGVFMLAALAACGDDDDDDGGGAASTSTTATAGEVEISLDSFTTDFKAMEQLRSLAAKGEGKIAVLLPDTASSARYVAFDEPYLKKAFEAAGLTSADYKIDNAQGSATTMQQQAEAAITEGATVLLIDQLDSGSAAAIQTNADARGEKVIDYDRLTKGGVAGRYYVSFDNVEVGKLIGQGMVECISDWKVDKPQILLMDGDPTDNNATLFAQGYKSVLDPKFASGDYVKVAEPGGTWDNQEALALFEQQYTAHPNINAVVAANDGLGQSVISALKTRGVPAGKVPVTGQDATVQGLQNVVAGYQCGSVYKPIYVEAQAAVAMALYLRAGEEPPASLVNGTTRDTTANADVKSVLLKPVWVNQENIADTVIKDEFVKVSDICTSALTSACSALGINK